MSNPTENQKLQELKSEIGAHRQACKEKGLKGRMAGFPEAIKKKTVELQKELEPEIKKSAFLKELGVAFTVFAGWDGKKPSKKTTKKASKREAKTPVIKKAPKATRATKVPKATKAKDVTEQVKNSPSLTRILKKKAEFEKLMLEVEAKFDANIATLKKVMDQPKLKI